MGSLLLERTAELEVLEGALASACDGRGSVVLLAGEAGIGKTSLIRSFLAGVGDGTRVLFGACDDLVTPRTLGAVRDAFAGRSRRWEEILADGTRDDLLVGVLAELTDPARPTVLVVEDIHWADEATLDVLRYVGRRVEGTSAMVVVSYRDDEIGRDHPAQRLLGGLAGAPVHRVVVPRLTPAAVATLAGGPGVTSAVSTALHELTGGNPFYVTEVVAAGDGAGTTVPLTVADAVLARLHRLAPATRSALEQLAVVPTQVELPLARALVGELTVLAEAERHGVLEVRPDAVAFRHELARRAVEASLPVSERMHIHSEVIEVLTARDDVDLTRVLHHAVEAGDETTVVEYARLAVAEAARVGSFVQEVTCLRLLLERERLLETPEIAEVHQRLASALWLVDEPSASLAHGLAAVRLREELGDVAALGEALSAVVPVLWTTTHTDDALASSARAIELLTSVPETPVGTFALVYHATLLGVVGEGDVLAAAEVAVESARRTDVPELVALAHATLGRARLLGGEPDVGLEMMRAGLAGTRAVNAHTFALITWALIVLDLFDLGRFPECRREAEEAVGYAHECGVLYLVGTLSAFTHRLRALRGEWEPATRGLREIVDARSAPESGVLRYALAPLAGLLARQGADDAPAMLARAADFARRAHCYDEVRRTALVEIETAWLTGRPADAGDAIARLEELTARPGREVDRGELNRWKRRLGLPHEVPPGCPPTTAAGIRGQWREAAAGWDAVGVPYHRALELLDSGEADPTLHAVEILEGLGAKPAAQVARRRLRALGVSHGVRGPRSETRSNPAGLTSRQVDVLRLVAAGLTNAEIAARLVISEKTADHHVSAILTKLDVANRREAAATARALGVAPDRRRAPRT